MHNAISLLHFWCNKQLSQPGSWPGFGRAIGVSNEQMKIILHLTILSFPFLCSCLHHPLSLLTSPSLRFQDLARVCVCGAGRVLCYWVAQCDSTVRSLTHSRAWSRPARSNRKEAHRKVSPLPILRVSLGPEKLFDKSEKKGWVLGLHGKILWSPSFFYHDLKFHSSFVKNLPQNTIMYLIDKN